MMCCYCKQNKELVKAHVIPEGFFRRMREGAHAPLLVKQSDHIKRAPIGIYDSGILCADCESIFGPWDDYAQRLLVTDLKNAELLTDGVQVGGWTIRNYRYDL